MGKGKANPNWYSKPEFANWVKPRGYAHFDIPVNERFARRIIDPVSGSDFVAKHSFSPMIHYIKITRRYKKISGTTINKRGKKVQKRVPDSKERPIKYASHRDSFIYTWYAYQLNKRLEEYYKYKMLEDNVLAYRSLGRGNYDFSADALKYCRNHSPVMILAFDVSSFFDTLDHSLLKMRLKQILHFSEKSEVGAINENGKGKSRLLAAISCIISTLHAHVRPVLFRKPSIPDIAKPIFQSLPLDWLRVFNSVTRYRYVNLEKLKHHPVFGPRLDEKLRPIANIRELKNEGVEFEPNPEVKNGKMRGIPQGTPISATLSNLYMIEFDAEAKRYCDKIGALYRRYSDDILIICKTEHEKCCERKIEDLLKKELLEIQPSKTERTYFDATRKVNLGMKSAQYLGFNLSESGATIREATLARQWRKMRRAIKRTRYIGKKEMAAGRADRVYTKRLRRRFSYLKVLSGTETREVRNFSSYARRSARAFERDEKITQQVRKFEREAEKEMIQLKSIKPKKP